MDLGGAVGSSEVGDGVGVVGRGLGVCIIVAVGTGVLAVEMISVKTGVSCEQAHKNNINVKNAMTRIKTLSRK